MRTIFTHDAVGPAKAGDPTFRILELAKDGIADGVRRARERGLDDCVVFTFEDGPLIVVRVFPRAMFLALPGIDEILDDYDRARLAAPATAGKIHSITCTSAGDVASGLLSLRTVLESKGGQG